jgi:hypothetical protein
MGRSGKSDVSFIFFWCILLLGQPKQQQTVVVGRHKVDSPSSIQRVTRYMMGEIRRKGSVEGRRVRNGK